VSKDPTQLPDIFIRLCHKGGLFSEEYIAYTRLKFVDILQKKNEVKPIWYNLRKTNTTLKGDSEENYIGLLLCAINIFPSDKTFNRPILIDNKNYKKYKLLSLIYMAKDLPNVSQGSVICPYAKVEFNGRSKQTKPDMGISKKDEKEDFKEKKDDAKVEKGTLNPVWGEALLIETLINEDLSLSDSIKLSCWDNTNIFGTEICIGRCEINLIEIKKYNNVRYIEQDLYNYATWYQLYDGVKPIQGKLLAAFFIVRLVKQGKEPIDMTKYNFWPVEEYYRVCLHIIGIRQVPKNLTAIIGGHSWARYNKEDMEKDKEECFIKRANMEYADNNINNFDVRINI